MDSKTMIVIAIVAVVAIGGIAAFALIQNNNEDDKNYVWYYANGGTSPEGDVIKSSQTTTLGTNLFTRTGYECTGWNTAKDGSGTVYNKDANVMLGTKLYAQWESTAGPHLKVTSMNTYSEKFNFSLGADVNSATNIDKAWEYKLKSGDRIFVTPAVSTSIVGVSGTDITIDVGDGWIYTIMPQMGEGGSITDVTVSANYATISFTFTGDQPTFGYFIHAQKK